MMMMNPEDNNNNNTMTPSSPADNDTEKSSENTTTGYYWGLCISTDMFFLCGNGTSTSQTATTATTTAELASSSSTAVAPRHHNHNRNNKNASNGNGSSSSSNTPTPAPAPLPIEDISDSDVATELPYVQYQSAAEETSRGDAAGAAAGVGAVAGVPGDANHHKSSAGRSSPSSSLPWAPSSSGCSVGVGDGGGGGGGPASEVRGGITKSSSMATEDETGSSVMGIDSILNYPVVDTQERREAFGWTLDAAARGVAVMGGAVFISTALLSEAKLAAGCSTSDLQQQQQQSSAEDGLENECDGRVYGMRPSSLLTNITTVVGLISAALMPIVGSIIDHTHHRRSVGRWSAAIFTGLIALQVLLLGHHLWFGSAIAQVAISFTYAVHLCAIYAYLPELTSDAKQLTRYAARFTAAQYSASILFLVVMTYILALVGVGTGSSSSTTATTATGSNAAFGNDDQDDYFIYTSTGDDDELISQERHEDTIASAQASQFVVVLVCTIFFSYAWNRLLGDRPAKQVVPAGQSIYSAGISKIIQTSLAIAHHHRAIKWFLVATSFTEAAATAFSSIAITYMTDQLHFSATENGIAILLLLVFAVPGTRIAAFMAHHFNPIRSLQMCLVLWMVNTGAAPLVLHGGGQQVTAMTFAVIWGVCIGWMYPTEKALYVSIIHKGAEAELMGVYICACQVLAWLPPLVFSIMNEMEVSMRIGLFSLNAYFFMSLLILFLMGDHADAVRHARDMDEGKIFFSAGATTTPLKSSMAALPTKVTSTVLARGTQTDHPYNGANENNRLNGNSVDPSKASTRVNHQSGGRCGKIPLGVPDDEEHVSGYRQFNHDGAPDSIT